MLQPIINYINTQINGTFYKDFGLVRTVSRVDRSGPAEYIGNGNYRDVDFDSNGSISYVRRNGIVNIADVTTEDLMGGCDYGAILTIPLRLVAYFPKDIFKSDNEFIDEKVVANLIQKIAYTNLKALRIEMKVAKVEIKATAYSVDPAQVWRGEFTGVPFTLNSGKSLVYIDFTVTLEADRKCWEEFGCEGC